MALLNREVVSGVRTTVGDLRNWAYGGRVQQHPLRDLFPSSSSTAPAVWCWTKESADSFTAWGVHEHDAAVPAITATGPTNEIPAGPPVIPRRRFVYTSAAMSATSGGPL